MDAAEASYSSGTLHIDNEHKKKRKRSTKLRREFDTFWKKILVTEGIVLDISEDSVRQERGIRCH